MAGIKLKYLVTSGVLGGILSFILGVLVLYGSLIFIAFSGSSNDFWILSGIFLVSCIVAIFGSFLLLKNKQFGAWLMLISALYIYYFNLQTLNFPINLITPTLILIPSLIVFSDKFTLLSNKISFVLGIYGLIIGLMNYQIIGNPFNIQLILSHFFPFFVMFYFLINTLGFILLERKAKLSLYLRILSILFLIVLWWLYLSKIYSNIAGKYIFTTTIIDHLNQLLPLIIITIALTISFKNLNNGRYLKKVSQPDKDIFKKNKLFIVSLSTMIIFFLIVFLLIPSQIIKHKLTLSASDFQIKEIQYGEIANMIAKTGVYSSVIIKNYVEDIYLRLYDVNDRERPLDESYYGYNGIPYELNIGDNTINFVYFFNDRKITSPKIRFCIGYDFKFDQNDRKVVCKIETFEPPSTNNST